MEGNQKINCTVYSCAFQNKDTCTCSLNDITVKACPNCNAQTPEESMCGSYRCKN
ncbi:MAG: DUF1540 domain-containing protein [Candidatus Scatovivens sp.]